MRGIVLALVIYWTFAVAVDNISAFVAPRPTRRNLVNKT
jgi:hypothetical protein